MNKYLATLVIISFSITLFGFGWMSRSAYHPVKEVTKEVTTLEKIQKNRVLNVVLLNSLSTYYIGTKGKQGFEYDLLKSFADHIGVELNITTGHTIEEVLELSKSLKPDITSAGLAKTPRREQTFNFGPSYAEVQEQVICYRGMLDKKNFPRDVENLAGLKIMIGKETSYAETIESLQADGFEINATITSGYSSEDLLAKVASHEIDCTLVDSNIYSTNIRYFPEISLAFSISKREQLAWLFAENSKDLKSSMYAWLNSFNQSGAMGELKDHYYSYVLFFDYYNTKMFYKRVESRLPKYKKFFMDAGKYYGIPWRLLAAISYQESHWNPKAKSFTGVRGMMMLTRKTAKLLDVKNRLDPKESIVGGTRHIKQMIKNVPKRVTGENRLKFALAAYNIGLGHIHDAQTLARKLNLDDTSWSDLKKTLPLLAYKKHYKTLKYGYARGSEPVRYVESIYNYRNILQSIDKNKTGENHEKK